MNDATKGTAVATAPAAPQKMQLSPVSDSGEFAELLDSNRFGQIQRVANLFSESDLVPLIFQGKPANCAVALQMAFRLRVDPMMLMQNMYIVHGRPGIEAKLAIALMNQRGPFTGPLQWKFEGEGEGRKCTCYATHRETNEQCAQTVTWAMVKAEGWLDKTGSKWETMPDIMFQYRSAMFLGRLYCPEVLLGLPTDDELRDVGPRVVSGQDEILLPRAKTAPAAGPAPIDVDTATGEASGPKANPTPDGPASGETSPKGKQEGAAGTPAPDAAEAGQAGSDLAGGMPAGMTTKASDAQKQTIIKVAKSASLSIAQMDEVLVEKFGMGIDEIPVGLVSQAITAVRGKVPARA